jgi:hypothetical protein
MDRDCKVQDTNDTDFKFRFISPNLDKFRVENKPFPFFSAALRIAILVSVAASVSLWAWPLGPTSTWATLLWLPRQFGFEPSWTPALVSALAPALNFHRLRSLSSHLQSPTRSPLLDQLVPDHPRASGTRRQLHPLRPINGEWCQARRRSTLASGGAS